MAKKPAEGNQSTTISSPPNHLDQISFNLEKFDQFVTGLGVTWVHYKAMPSPIGMVDRGDYRRSEALDTISSNGFIYKKCGVFTAAMTGNSKQRREVEGGLYDNSTARITLPRFYDKDKETDEDITIYLAPGDRVYIKDMEVPVVTYQNVNHNPNGVDFLQFPALCVEALIDSRGIDYKENVDFKVNNHGNIEWIQGRRNPGIDENTGTGRVFSVRYRYNAFWIIASLINEVRVTNITKDNIRQPARLPYHAVIQREYVYHNQANNGSNENQKNTNDTERPSRVAPKPTEPIDPNKYQVKVNINSFDDN